MVDMHKVLCLTPGETVNIVDAKTLETLPAS